MERGYCNLEEIGDVEVIDIVIEMISFEIFILKFVSVVCMFCYSFWIINENYIVYVEKYLLSRIWFEKK